VLTPEQRDALAERLRRGREDTAAAPIPRRTGGLAREAALPLSCGQEQLWFLDRFAPGLPTYNIVCALALSGPLDDAALDRALTGLVVRHEALRTRLVTAEGGHPVQVIGAPGPVTADRVDLSGLAPGPRQAALSELADTEAARPFDLAAGPLLRTWLVRLEPARHVLLSVVHHTVFDGWSAGVLARDLAALYGAEVTGESSGLDPLPVQFADYAVWERDRLQGPVLAELAGYWRGALDGFETVQLPADRPRPVLDTFDGAVAGHLAGRDLLDGLRELSRREGTTLFVTLMAGLQALLHRYTGQADITVGTVSASRGRAELAPLIGFLVNMLPIRGDLSGDPPFTGLLARLKDATIGAYAHQDLPLGKLVEAIALERDLSRAPVFQIALSYAEPDHAEWTAGGLTVAPARLELGVNPAKFDLTIVAEARDAGLWLECIYKTGLFDAATVERLLGHLEVLLRGAVADPAARLSALPVLTEAELYAELIEWNDTAAEVPPGCVHEAIAAQAARRPAAVAAEFEGQRWTYAELLERAEPIAARLRAAGVGPEVLTGVCMATGLPRLAALLGIWLAGGGYVPLDPAAPADRLAFMIADTAMPVILTDDASAANLPAPGQPATDALVLNLDAEPDAISRLDSTGPAGAGVRPENVAYVIYTSGSTGQPKGVVIEHRQAMNFLHGLVSNWAVTPRDAVLAFSSLTFDASVIDLFTPLLAGARVVLAPPETRHSPPRLAALLRSAGITFVLLPPAVLSLLDDEPFPALRVLLTGGEELPGELARRWAGRDLTFVNAYGPTEATVMATYQVLDSGSPVPPPIGRANRPNYQVYVLDPQLSPVPAGVIGELHVGGAGVARGYLNRPELTRERFIPDPFSETPGARLYKTGDLVRRRPDGAIVFVGRIDDQVKIRGLRIELGEIEAALLAHPGVAQAVATVVTGPAGDRQLAAYLRPACDRPVPRLEELREHLARRLPGYMVPAELVVLDRFPLNASGKVDKAALPPPELTATSGYVAPATVIETLVADFYATLLGREQVGATDSFFDLGGSSLQAMRLISVLDEELDVDVGPAAVFLAATPRQLTALLRDKHGLDDAELTPEDLDGLDELDAGVGSP
jgi:amino acid adenylation domain-containing protein